MHEGNPYAPPAESTLPLAPAYGWSVQGDVLLVRDGTNLPEIDLDGRGSTGPLTPVVLGFMSGAGRMSVIRVVLIVLMLAVLVGQLRKFTGTGGTWGVVAVTLLFAFLLRRAAGPAMLHTVKAHAAVPELRRRMRRTRWRGRMSWAGLLLIVGAAGSLPVLASPAGRAGGPGLAWTILAAMVAGILLLLAGVLWQGFERRWLCRRHRDGWLHLTGVGPAALAALAARQAEPPPPPRSCRVFTVFLHRMPLLTLVRPYPWNLWAWFSIALMKMTRSKAFEVAAFHAGERRWLPPAEGDPELRAAWDRETSGTPLAAWRAIHAAVQDSPVGNLRVNELAFLSPDGLHAALVSVTRVANARLFLEQREIGFRSWTTDGRTLATGSAPLDAPPAPDFDFQRVKGPPSRVVEVHLRRAAGCELRVMDPAAVMQREQADRDERQRSGEAAGIYGPVTTVELPGLP